MTNDITDEDIKKVLNSSINLSFEQIFADLKIGKLPNVEPIILSNGYGAGMSIDYDKKRKIRHIYISNPIGEIDPAIADKIAMRILGNGSVFIGPMSTKGVFHYMKEDSHR